jgi:hypothetical protein
MMSNGAANCELEICCPPLESGEAAPKSIEALAHSLEEAGLPKDYCRMAAKIVLHQNDLMPRGSTHQFKATIAKLARETP